MGHSVEQNTKSLFFCPLHEIPTSLRAIFLLLETQYLSTQAMMQAMERPAAKTRNTPPTFFMPSSAASFSFVS